MIDSQAQYLTWAASVICAAAVISESIKTHSGLKRGLPNSAFFLLESKWFLPFYYAGIVQWLIFGLRSENPALSIPCGLQLAAMTPLLICWARRRMEQ